MTLTTAIGNWVASTYATLATVLAGIAANPPIITTTAQVDSAFTARHDVLTSPEPRRRDVIGLNVPAIIKSGYKPHFSPAAREGGEAFRVHGGEARSQGPRSAG